MRFIPIAIIAAITLSACGHTTPQKRSDAEAKPRPVAQAQEAQPTRAVPKASAAEYKDFSGGVIGNGEESVLFFHATWCSTCVKEDKNLRSWYPSQDMLPLYKIDYDSNTDLRKKYGVNMQHTFVKIDKKGNVVKVLPGPTPDALKSFLSA
ncbi:MAG: thioredoxin family protein [Candidatus Peribacteraceae bacterium]|jgi:thiol-disulfide isomerase/thioredoxin|nr:thioredoxin family protein [Candidatus Peribacteraceae bacterium]MDP7454684.1 thioredoxin family protein [Candidatus Peribacteraceae bacterium]MDP7646085.1 thioredoxin family protein [Candidatus Peribacteraceae bacterium]|tara:strand:+ start:123 stop:575 length:453 start_codon:yes stop_codon:yes gene_type:complete